MFGWFFNKKEVEQVKEDTKRSFESVKNDINHVTVWIKHLDSEKKAQKEEVSEIKEEIASIKDEMENIKNMISLLGNLKQPGVFRQPSRLSNKQTAVQAVQTAVQTAVYTPNLDQFSVTERAIIWILLNTDMNLSYEDLSTVLGKEKSTLRSQINGIKAKSEGLIEEMVEKNGKKRVYIPEEIKEKLLKKVKVRVESAKKRAKKE
jgi:septal ring factor EnvC (AmiA/AmiB activator)